ncbi:MAG TPA: hypothetical protein VGE97_06875 [Nitrososphaera sp.]|jgi:hypothetical protein
MITTKQLQQQRIDEVTSFIEQQVRQLKSTEVNNIFHLLINPTKSVNDEIELIESVVLQNKEQLDDNNKLVHESDWSILEGLTA